jgi:hypothetical protein
MKYLIIVLLGMCIQDACAQTLKTLSPVLGWTRDLNAAGENALKRRDALLAKSSLTPAEQKELDKLLEDYAETLEDLGDVEGSACSWYCGEGPYKIIASSTLPKQGDNEYDGEKAHDLTLRTAWVEGVKGYGAGQYIEYYFRNQAPRITDIMIFNGYVKSDKAWAENSRVKKLKLTINGKDYAMLSLADARAQQIFKVDPLGRRKDGQDLVLRFTIEEVYPGSKYDDTCITEIYFDGLDVHCFAKGTMITMAHGGDKPIEKIAPGDTILTFDPEQNRFYPDVIEKTERVNHHDLVKYTFEDGSTVTCTKDHPFLVEGKGWSSFDPVKSKSYKGFENVRQIKTGDRFLHQEVEGKELGKIRLTSIEVIHGLQETYTISKLRSGESFIANGFIVAVEEIAATSVNH